jgi:hypothetical protein
MTLSHDLLLTLYQPERERRERKSKTGFVTYRKKSNKIVLLNFSILLQLVLEFILGSVYRPLCNDVKDLKLNPFKIRHCTICFGLFGHHQTR